MGRVSITARDEFFNSKPPKTNQKKREKFHARETDPPMTDKQLRLSFPAFKSRDELPEGFRFTGPDPSASPTVDLTKKLTKRKKTDEEDDDSYEDGKPTKRINKSRVYASMAEVQDEKLVGPREKSGYKKGITSSIWYFFILF